MVSQQNWPTVIKRARKSIQWIIVLLAVAVLYINYGWLIQLFNNI